MRFIVTGSSGYVGPHLLNRLLEDDHEVYALYRTNYEDTVDVLKYNFIKIKWIQGDLTDYSRIENVFKSRKFEGCFHLSGMVHPPTAFEQPVMTFKNNALGTVYLVDALVKYNPFCVLHNCSTSEVYGAAKSRITEFHPRLPNNPYSVSKYASELYVTEQAGEGKLRAFSTRAFSHTGARRRNNFAIASDAYQIALILNGKQDNFIRIGNMSSVRNVMDVRDTVDVYYQLMMKAIKNQIPNGDIFNICGDELHDMMWYLDLMLDIANIKPKLIIDKNLFRKVDIPIQNPDSTKVRKLLNWSPKIPIRETLTDLINYHIEKTR